MAQQDRRGSRRSSAAWSRCATFMFKQTRDDRPRALHPAQRRGAPRRRAPTSRPSCSIPAFIISELKTAFQIGFLIFLPFLIIDMVVSSTLMSMGMMMLPPVLVSLPFKILLFVLVDGWHLVVAVASSTRSTDRRPMNRGHRRSTSPSRRWSSRSSLGARSCSPGLIVGLVVSIFQAATQIQEMTLTFIPKIVVTGVVLAIAGPWMLDQLVGYTRELFIGIPQLVGAVDATWRCTLACRSPAEQIVAFMLVLARVGGLFVLAPVFSAKADPGRGPSSSPPARSRWR